MQETNAVNVSDNPTPPPPPPPPPTNNRRPRTREVSSRFMTPSASTTHRRQQRDDSDDENSESSFPIGYSFQKKQLQQRAIKLFKESTNNRVFENTPNPNSHSHSHHPPKSTTSRIERINSTSTPCASRPDTPTISVSSRYRHTPNHHQQHHRSISNSRSSAATKLVQSSVNSLSRGNSISSNSHSHDDIGISCSTQSLPELRSESDSDREVLIIQQQSNVNNGSVAEKIGNNNLSRSVSLSSSGIDHLLVRGSERQHASVSKPPVAPQFAKPVVDTRKGKKGSSHQEDVHSLRMFYNRYLQWRFANARAVNAMKVQQKECEKALFSRAMKISEMRDSVHRKRLELELLRRSKTLSIVLEAQIPYLDEWSAMEENYSVSINEAIQALLNASVRLPTGGNVRVDVREVGESLNSALKVLETIISNTQRLMPKAEETDTSISELARVVGGERALIEECGGLLSKTHKSQVEECSLRAQLIQLHSICHTNKNNEITSN